MFVYVRLRKMRKLFISSPSDDYNHDGRRDKKSKGSGAKPHA